MRRTPTEQPDDPAARQDAALRELAHRHGVATEYQDGAGESVPVSRRTVLAVLASLGVPVDTPEAVQQAVHTARQGASGGLPRCVVARAGTVPAVPVPEGTALDVTLESGVRRRLRPGEALPGDLPCGYHTLHAHPPNSTGGAGGAGRVDSAPLLVTPNQVPQPPRAWGLLAQLYSLLSARSWGMGDLGDLAEVTAWAGAELGAGFVQINPLHAASPVPPVDPSPYRPATRTFPDPVHLAVDELPECAELPPAHREQLERLRADGAAFRHAVGAPNGQDDTRQLINRDAVWRLKREALLLLHAVPRQPAREDDYQRFLVEGGKRLRDHATWCALAETYGPGGDGFGGWPEELRVPEAPAVAAFAARHPVLVDFHSWLAWLTDRQLAAAQHRARAAGMPVGVVHDLAVGAHPEGSDAWALHRFLAADMSLGAPPDAFNPHGQDWGLPPWRPDALAAAGYAPYRDMLRSVLRHAGGLRVDHVMGLFRLWWVPRGCPPTEGTYVSYDPEAMLGILALEAARADAVVIGEDLGTVEPGVRDTLAERGVLGTSVLWFEHEERDAATGTHVPAPPRPPWRWRQRCLATLTTHDLPSTAARLSGEHVALRHRLGLLDGDLNAEYAAEAVQRDRWLELLVTLGLLPPVGAADREAGCRAAEGLFVGDAPDGEEQVVLALHRFLRRTPALLTGVWLPDAVGDRRPQNLPGTVDTYPNWRLPLADSAGRPLSVESLRDSPRVARLAGALRDA